MANLYLDVVNSLLDYHVLDNSYDTIAFSDIGSKYTQIFNWIKYYVIHAVNLVEVYGLDSTNETNTKADFFENQKSTVQSMIIILRIMQILAKDSCVKQEIRNIDDVIFGNMINHNLAKSSDLISQFISC